MSLHFLCSLVELDIKKLMLVFLNKMNESKMFSHPLNS